MAKFNVFLKRRTEETATIEVDTLNADDAEDKVLTMIENGADDLNQMVEWEYEDGGISILGMEKKET